MHILPLKSRMIDDAEGTQKHHQADKRTLDPALNGLLHYKNISFQEGYHPPSRKNNRFHHAAILHPAVMGRQWIAQALQ